MTILYVNGSSHTAAALATNQYIFASDDRLYWAQAKRPHPVNLSASWSANLSGLLKMPLYTDAEGDSSNQRIIESTKKWMELTEVEAFMIIEFTPVDLDMIVDFHNYLNGREIKHIFFNGADSFLTIPEENRYDFGSSYINPYLHECSFSGHLLQMGHEPVITSNEFFGTTAHSAWTNYLIKHITGNKML